MQLFCEQVNLNLYSGRVIQGVFILKLLILKFSDINAKTGLFLDALVLWSEG